MNAFLFGLVLFGLVWFCLVLFGLAHNSFSFASAGYWQTSTTFSALHPTAMSAALQPARVVSARRLIMSFESATVILCSFLSWANRSTITGSYACCSSERWLAKSALASHIYGALVSRVLVVAVVVVLVVCYN
jgi:hypothetical protein